MARPAEDGRRPNSSARTWLGAAVRHERETLLFVLVSALDVFMTWLLLHRDGFVESNPVALYFLNHWGLKGLVYFKMAMVALVCVVAQIIARQRPDTARTLLNLATLVVAGVVIYSFVLLARHSPPSLPF